MEKMVNEDSLKKYYSGKKVFITGHTGFKGSWLSLWLKILGAQIKGYALAPEYGGGIYEQANPFSPALDVIADIRDKEKLTHALLSFKPDFIFHLAAQPLVRRSYRIPAETFDINVTGTANLLEAVKALQNKCTVIIITTDKVYLNKEKDILYKEEDALGGYDPYSASKACTELAVSAFRNSFFNTLEYRHHQKAIATVRAGNVMGGGDFSEDRLVPDIIKAIMEKREVELRSPASVRPWQHVLEPLGGYLLLGGLLHDDIQYSGAYNLGPEPEDHLTVQQLAEEAIAILGTGNWKYTGDSTQPHEAGILKLSIEKAKTKLGWQPKLNARQAIALTMNWYKNAKNQVDAFSTKQIFDYMQK